MEPDTEFDSSIGPKSKSLWEEVKSLQQSEPPTLELCPDFDGNKLFTLIRFAEYYIQYGDVGALNDEEKKDPVLLEARVNTLKWAQEWILHERDNLSWPACWLRIVQEDSDERLLQIAVELQELLANPQYSWMTLEALFLRLGKEELESALQEVKVMVSKMELLSERGEETPATETTGSSEDLPVVVEVNGILRRLNSERKFLRRLVAKIQNRYTKWHALAKLVKVITENMV